MRTGRGKKCKRKVNNAGFSLVELLVSIIILAIIVVPLLNSFLTATRTNAKAKRVMEATTVAQNEMEKVKAQSVADFVSLASPSALNLTDDAGNEILDADGKKYNKYVQTVACAVNGRSYDAVVTLSPEKYISSSTPVVSGGSISTNYNSAKIPQISNMNPKVSASFIMDKGDDERAVAKLNLEAYASEEEGVKETYITSVKRRLIIDINKDDVSGQVTVNGTLYYNDDAGHELSPYYQHSLYTSNPPESTLENIFVCFTPLPGLDVDGCNGGYENETIIVNNTKNVPVKLYLVKQQSGTETANPTVFKDNYHVKVQVNEGAKGTDDLASCQMITNLFYDDNQTNSNLLLTYQSEGSFIRSGGDARQKLQLNQDQSLTENKSTNLIYDIEVKVYPNGKIVDGEELATLTGTKTK